MLIVPEKIKDSETTDLIHAVHNLLTSMSVGECVELWEIKDRIKISVLTNVAEKRNIGLIPIEHPKNQAREGMSYKEEKRHSDKKIRFCRTC